MNPDTSLEHAAASSENRDAFMLSNWLINSDEYAIITACDSHEEAKEIKLENGQTHKVLIYFLLLF
jgi:hypothetical protein